MAKIGENVSALIDKTVDFMASSQAFREYLNKTPPRNVVLLKYRRRMRSCICNVWRTIGSFIDRSRKRNKQASSYF